MRVFGTNGIFSVTASGNRWMTLAAPAIIGPLVSGGNASVSDTVTVPPQAPRIDLLTESEMAVLRLVARGVENEHIAQTLNYSVYTVANRLRTIYEKLHVNNRTQAALYALRHGWATLDEPPA